MMLPKSSVMKLFIPSKPRAMFFFFGLKLLQKKIFYDTTSSVLTKCHGRPKEYRFFEIVKGVGKTSAVELFAGCDGFVNANRIGNLT